VAVAPHTVPGLSCPPLPDLGLGPADPAHVTNRDAAGRQHDDGAGGARWKTGSEGDPRITLGPGVLTAASPPGRLVLAAAVAGIVSSVSWPSRRTPLGAVGTRFAGWRDNAEALARIGHAGVAACSAANLEGQNAAPPSSEGATRGVAEASPQLPAQLGCSASGRRASRPPQQLMRAPAA